MGLFSGIGKALNSITGASSSQSSQHKYNTALSNLSFKQQKELNQMSYAEQEKLLKMQQAYDTQMANTAVKRQMNDYMASGINPAMVVTGGGAGGGSVSTPSASAGSTSAGSVSAPTTGMSITDIANSATQAYDAFKRAKTQDEITPSQIGLNNSIENKNNADATKTILESKWVEPEKKAQIAHKNAIITNLNQNTALQTEQAEKTKHERRTGQLGRTIGSIGTNYLENIGNNINKSNQWNEKSSKTKNWQKRLPRM